MVSGSSSVGTELWLCWAYIALDQERQAQDARKSLAPEIAAGNQPDLNLELYPTMQAIAAAAASLDCFANLVKELVPAPAPAAPNPTRAHWVWETLRAGFDVGSKASIWPRDLKDLFKLRNGQMHSTTVFGATAQHPLLPGVTRVRATYTAEAAERSGALMRDVYRTCSTRVRPALPGLESRMDGLKSHFAIIAP